MTTQEFIEAKREEFVEKIEESDDMAGCTGFSSINSTLLSNWLETYTTELVAMVEKEERENIPVGFLRQFINERTTEEHKKLLTNEDIMKFINIGYKI